MNIVMHYDPCNNTAGRDQWVFITCICYDDCYKAVSIFLIACNYNYKLYYQL